MCDLAQAIDACTLCADRFAATATAHRPRPVAWFRPNARILIVGQAPGARVHASGVPFSDASGDRLRAWMGVDGDTFRDISRISIVPMAFCFPGYSTKGADLPPPSICARTWRAEVLGEIGPVPLTLLVGGHSQAWHLGAGRVGARVAEWCTHAPAIFPLPHPSWRNTAWLAKHLWFEAELLPALRTAVAEVLR